MRFSNSWKAKNKQGDKIAIKVRIGKLTVFDLSADMSRKSWIVTVFNLSVKNG